MNLESPITELKGVGGEVASKLALLGVSTVGDLIENYPRKYEDYSQISKIGQLSPGVVTVQAKIVQVNGRYVRRGMHITEALASDETGSVRLVWFNQPYRAATVKDNSEYFISGDFQLRRGRFSILNPSAELASDFPINTARIIPIYRETKGLKSFTIRKLIREAIKQINQLPEHLPTWVLKQNDLIGIAVASTEMHFPSSPAELQLAQKRLGFEEVFQLSLAALLNKYELYQDKAIAINFNAQLAKNFVAQLPFRLTNAQRRAAWLILNDLSKTQPMNRLLEGDVGSGKTVVAAMAALMTSHSKMQTAIMAPTEILAQQHYRSLVEILKFAGLDDSIVLLTGSLKSSLKEAARKKIKSGQASIIVGTHALIAEKIDMHNLGLVVIDEQHRFGVKQRKALQSKAGHMPHVLHMSATPIPRSLALTLYGELDISILDELPAGRKPIITKLVSPNSKAQLFEKVKAQIDSGRQVFVVCPNISETESSTRVAVETIFKHLSTKDFKNYNVALLHGKMKPIEKDQVMADFVAGTVNILVCTTVIEVGVDVPNASVMIIEGAEFFGLAQIHQLRGRVGRGHHQSYCYLQPSSSQTGLTRLRSLETISDGFRLAELDLKLRGPGAIYGSLQHGELDLRVANLEDIKLIKQARESAQQFIEKGENLLKYPQLAERVTALRSVTNLN